MKHAIAAALASSAPCEDNMLRRDFLKTTLATAVLTAVLPVQAKKTLAMPNQHFADVNGQHLFYSVHGAGKPLILLHGGINPDSFGSNLTELAKGRQVIAVHLQAHGRTPDTDRPLRSETMGDDMAALIGHLNLRKADVMGYSLGASVALQTAIRHPDVVDRLVLVSAAMRQDGFYPEAVTAFKQLEANAATLGPSVKASPLGQTYPNVDWTNLFKKVGDMTKRPFDWSADVAKLHTRTLLVYADADAIRPEHMVEFWKALGGGQRDAGIDGSLRPANELAILPNTTHYTIPVDPMLPEIVGRFLVAASKAAG
ncbi:MAG TPA: alpha/beta hydrolase [Dyella sp.]|nr:alpha/beta hydrolase [Dyella sp.]